MGAEQRPAQEEVLEWSEDVAERLRGNFEDAKDAFLHFLGRTISNRLDELKDLLPSLNLNETTVSKEIFRSYARGMRDAARVVQISKGDADITDSANLALLLDKDPKAFAYALGRSRVPPVYLDARHARAGVEGVGATCSLQKARQLIRKFDSSKYLNRDGRLSFQDFERLYHFGVDHYVRHLEQAARDIAFTEKLKSGALTRTAKRPWSDKRYVKARDALFERLRARAADNRAAFDDDLLMARLSEHARFLQDQVTAAYVRLSKVAFAEVPSVQVEVSVSGAGGVDVAMTDPALPPLGPCASLSWVDRAGTGHCGLAALRLALVEAGLPLSATEVLQVAGRFGQPVSGGVSAKAHRGATSTEVHWAALIASLMLPDDDLDEILTWSREEATWWRDRATEARRRDLARTPLLEDLCELRCHVDWKHEARGGPARAPAGAAAPPDLHPVADMPLVKRLVGVMDRRRAALTRAFVALEKHAAPPRRSLARDGLVYGVRMVSDHGPCGALGAREIDALMATFAAPNLPGLAAKVKHEHVQVDYVAVLRAISPLKAEVEVEKAALGTSLWGLRPEVAAPVGTAGAAEGLAAEDDRDASDPLAAVVRLSCVVYRDWVRLVAGLLSVVQFDEESAVVSVEQARALFEEALGVQASEAEMAALGAFVGKRGNVDVARLVAVLCCALEDAAAQDVTLVWRVTDAGEFRTGLVSLEPPAL
ncbi:unnamed protein product [Pedinophyceae sp. YPF-701]|nr:unnamed protein product [Pedinophyceae sp. YPF-701]